jgi:Putative beta-lactamase-inhibitor-like, PepSY-like
MKKVLVMFSLFIYLFGVTSAEAQVVDIPNKSKEHFFKKYPDAKNADWNNNAVSYAVKFNLGSDTYRAYYHMDGTWDYTEKYMEMADLPQSVKDSYAKSRIADWKLESVAWVENNKGKKRYRIEASKGIEKKTIYYDKNGKEVKSSSGL